MKKIILAFSLVLGLFFRPWLHADNISEPQTDIATWQHNAATDTALAISSRGQVNMPDGLTVNHETFNFSVEPSSAAFLFVGISTLALVNHTTTYVGGDFRAQPRHPMVLLFQITTLHNVSTFTYLSTATVRGYNARGERIQELIRISSTPTKSLYAYGTISSVTYMSVPQALTVEGSTGVQIIIGSTDTFGLVSDLRVNDDAHLINMFGINNTNCTVNSTYDTVKSSGNLRGIVEVWGRNKQSPIGRRYDQW